MNNRDDIKENHIPTESELKESFKKIVLGAIFSAIMIPAISFYYFVIYIPERVGGTTNEVLIFLMGVIVPLLVFAMLGIFGFATVILIIIALNIRKKMKSNEFM